MMNEKLLQFIWKHKLFAIEKVKQTTQNIAIEIIHTGIWNHDQGPDFTNCKIKIGETTWAGNVELHIKASDWNKHQHQHQAAYHNIIAHVVYDADVEIMDENGNTIPCIALKDSIDQQLLQQYATLMNEGNAIACAKNLHQVKEITQTQQWEKALSERLLQKSEAVNLLLEATNNDWNEVLYIHTARAFGIKINADALEALASRLPLRTVAKNKNSLLQIEAMLYGVAGMLAATSDLPYYKQLQTEYMFLKKKYGLQEMELKRWKFLRLRPANFPTIRIAQFAQLLFQSHQLFSKIIECEADIKKLKSLFTLTASSFWDTHYTFSSTESKTMPKKLGNTFIDNLLINAIVPTLFIYGKHLHEQKYCDNAIAILNHLPAEKNSIISHFTALKIPCTNAAQSQALLQQYNAYCSIKKCLQCSIGFSLLKS